MKGSPVKREEEINKIDNLLSFYKLENEKSSACIKNTNNYSSVYSIEYAMATSIEPKVIKQIAKLIVPETH